MRNFLSNRYVKITGIYLIIGLFFATFWVVDLHFQLEDMKESLNETPTESGDPIVDLIKALEQLQTVLILANEDEIRGTMPKEFVKRTIVWPHYLMKYIAEE